MRVWSHAPYHPNASDLATRLLDWATTAFAAEYRVETQVLTGCRLTVQQEDKSSYRSLFLPKSAVLLNAKCLLSALRMSDQEGEYQGF
jgi:hypothetical protein